MSVLRAMAFAAMLIGLSACGGGSGEPRPPDIAYGRDTSDNMCGMIISEPRFASGSVLANGDNHKFDDIADMVMYHLDHPNEKVAAFFVHDYETEAWIRAETAVYVAAKGIRTPMDRGLAAFVKKEAAAAFSQRVRGQALSYDQMRLWVHENLHH